MANKKSKKPEKLKGFSDPPEIKEAEELLKNTTAHKESKEEKPEEQTGSYVVDTDMNTYDNTEEDKPLFVPTDVKIENIKTGLRQERINKDKQLVDYWLRHELQLGTVLIKRMWKKMDEIYR
jgi:hypothetical protein